jgi:hypothetical protein
MVIAGETTSLKTPVEVAIILHEHADKSISILETLESSDNSELEFTLHDIHSMALLGKYYAFKISGSAQLALYRETNDKKYQELAVLELEKALTAWKNYTKNALQQNVNPLWTNRVGYVDWVKITDWVADDIKIAKGQ